ncbi:glycoside hydrolase family 13 protein [Cellulomonas wangsupingiae]|uniref:Glycoside hydrolase family 13 protein n=1 Tax=Cellulomonas wangsupingiae TaxID=2968085 RepID=A0ABY5K1S5_9CELL|nr:glycoside hydrolase family 13 protein [Cellulomonas wangsupingiae]MCC2333577.1 glycoside hydrolase family 13 protein [Cellulomonas wangsupingiae]UUI63759.1 glycoside hydrolase family 13 protein [Cellulomonas wangsupingiae]
MTLETLPTGLVAHRPDTDAQWWRHAVIYQVYPRSFADASGDGIGDLPGVTARLDHLVELGVDAVWLSPFYRSPQADAGYDVADYRDVDPLFGTLADADALVARAHELGLRVVVDLVPNHTSDEHVWFRAALASAPGSPERARYHFREGRGEHGELPPNNWESVFGGPAWTRTTQPDGTPGQWYLHLFDSKQPDLNWENPEVRAEFEDVLRFWLDRGVDGFRVDVAHGMVKQDGLPDWDGHVAMIDGSDDTDAVAGTGNHGPMFDQDGVHDIYRSWRRVLDAYDGDRAMVAEAWVEPLSRLARYVRPDEMHQAFNFAFLAAGWHAPSLRRVIDASFAANDAVGAPTTWVMSNHDVVRHASRLGLTDPTHRPNGIGDGDEQPDAVLGLHRARAASLLMLALPGSAYVYQGEELGLPDHTALDDDLRQDPAFFRTGGAERGRDGCRVPLPWEGDAPGLGFSPTGATWLPQPTAWADLAVDRQRGREGSTYELYRAALRLRRAERLGAGGLQWLTEPAGEHVLAFRNGDVVVVANLDEADVELPLSGEVLLASGPLRDGVLPAGTTVWLRAA